MISIPRYNFEEDARHKTFFVAFHVLLEIFRPAQAAYRLRGALRRGHYRRSRSLERCQLQRKEVDVGLHAKARGCHVDDHGLIARGGDVDPPHAVGHPKVETAQYTTRGAFKLTSTSILVHVNVLE